MRQRVDKSRPGINIAPQTLHQMMDAEYAQGFASPDKRPWREGLLWRTFKWSSVLTLLCFIGVVIYAVKFVDPAVRQQDDVDRILSRPPASTPNGEASTGGLDTGTFGVRASDSPLLAAATPRPKTSWVHFGISTSTDSVISAEDSIDFEVRTVLDGANGWYRVSTGTGDDYTVAVLGATLSVQMPDSQWYQGARDDEPARVMWPFERAAPTVLADVISAELRPYAYLQRLGTDDDLDVDVTTYRVNFDMDALGKDPAARAAYEEFVDSGDPARPFASHELSFDRDGVLRRTVSATAPDAQGVAVTVRRELAGYGDGAVSFPTSRAPLPLPGDLELPVLPN